MPTRGVLKPCVCEVAHSAPGCGTDGRERPIVPKGPCFLRFGSFRQVVTLIVGVGSFANENWTFAGVCLTFGPRWW